jgi:hypothetical protein
MLQADRVNPATKMWLKYQYLDSEASKANKGKTVV